MLQRLSIPRLVWGAAIALVVVQTTITGLALSRAHQRAVQDKGAVVAEVARSAEASVNRTILQVDALLTGLGQLMRLLPADGPWTRRAVARLLEELNNQNFVVRDILIYDHVGHPLNAAGRVSQHRPPAMPTDLRLAIIADPVAGLHIGRPTLNPRTGDWAVPFGRLLRLPDGERVFAVAEVPLYAIAELLSDSANLLGIQVHLERGNGELMAAMPHDEMRMGQVLGAPLPREQTTGEAALRRGRLVDAPAITAIRPVPHRPLFIHAAIGTDQALAAWIRDVAIGIAISAAFALLVLGGAAILSRVLRLREAALAETVVLQQTLRSAIESMTDGFALFDSQDRFIACNSRYLEMFSHLRAIATPGRGFHEFAAAASHALLPDASEELRRDWIEERIRTHRDASAEGEEIALDGKIIHATTWRTTEGGLAAVYRDVTAQRAQEAALKSAKDAAEVASRAKSSFLAHMSHELRTPLNAILGFSEIIREKAFGSRAIAKYANYASDIHRSGSHLLSLISDILDLSKVEAGRVELARERVVLSDLLDECFAMVGAVAAEKQISLKRRHSGAQAVISDGRVLKQIVLNVLANAVKFTPSGGRVSISVDAAAPGALKVLCTDTGVGMSAETLRHLFEPFHRGDAMVAREFGGTGLGLAIVKRYVDLLNGQISFDSEVGKGTSVAIRVAVDSADPSGDATRSTATRVNVAGK